MSTDYNKLFEKKKYSMRDVKREIKLYTLDRENNQVQLYGSLSYKTAGASDVDLFEKVNKDNLNMIILFFIRNIKRIVKDLNKDKKQYFAEVKFGIDPLYDLDYGSCQSDTYNVNSDFFDKMALYHRLNLISNDEIQEIKNVETMPNKNQWAFEMVQSIIRSHRILRWSAKDIHNGYKVLNHFVGNTIKPYKFHMNEALLAKSPVNIEGIFINNDNKYMEVSNYFVLEHDNKALNLSDESVYDLNSYISEQLKESMYKLLYSKIDPNYFKVVKRMLSFARLPHIHDLSLLEKSYMIINSQLGVLYNLTSQLKTIIKLLKKHGSKYLNKTSVYHTLDSIRFRLQDLIFIDFKGMESLLILINEVLGNTVVTEKELCDALENITHELIDYINAKTLVCLRNAGLYPLGDGLIPMVKPF